jgi:transcriptional regulator with XRE-family HTH domain
MTSSFGARLRQHREERGIPLSVIAGQTKIKVSLLEGLERDDLAHWPPGIFRRAYLRAYANAVGLNADAVVNEFLTVYPETPEVIDAGALHNEGSTTNGGAPTRLRHLFGSAVGSLSRLRRGPAIEEPLRAQGTSGSAISLSLTPPPRPRVEPDLREEPDEPEPIAEAERAEAPLFDPEPPISDLRSSSPDPQPPLSDPQPVMPGSPSVDLLAAAELCTALGRVENASQMPPLLRRAAEILGARGLIVWVWDPIARELQPALVYGYPDKLVAQLPRLAPDADNVTAAAFRSSETLAIGGNAEASAALAVPLQAPGSCAGVLAIELPPGAEEADSVRAVAIVFAAMLAQLVGAAPAADQSLPSDGSRPAISTAV